MAILKPFQLLEINIISAQDLEPVSRKMRTYATAWVNPNRKLSSRVDVEGKTNPTWNDKFVFRVDEEFLRQDTSAVMIEIHAVHWFRDTLVGTVRVLVGNLITPPTRPHHGNHHIGMRFVALQVRRPSGRPQGILNIGVALLDSSMRSMPLYTQPASAVGYRVLMGEEDTHLQNNKNNDNNNNNKPEPLLRRTRSEKSTLFDNFSMNNSSIVAIPKVKGGSIISISEAADPMKGNMIKKAGKASSVINGAELLREKPKLIKGKKAGKASSVVSDSIVSKESSLHKKEGAQNNVEKDGKKKLIEKPAGSVIGEPTRTKTSPKPNPNNKVVNKKNNGYDFISPPGKVSKPNGNKLIGGKAGSIIWSDSEVGPSPSEVAAAMAERRYPLDQDNQSSVLDGWSLDESVEGLRSKLERWRTELPPLYDRGFSSRSSFSFRSTGEKPHTRRHSEGAGGSGLFSCFGNICGYECQCVCGKPPERKMRSKYPSPPSSFL